MRTGVWADRQAAKEAEKDAAYGCMLNAAGEDARGVAVRDGGGVAVLLAGMHCDEYSASYRVFFRNGILLRCVGMMQEGLRPPSAAPSFIPLVRASCPALLPFPRRQRAGRSRNIDMGLCVCNQPCVTAVQEERLLLLISFISIPQKCWFTLVKYPIESGAHGIAIAMHAWARGRKSLPVLHSVS